MGKTYDGIDATLAEWLARQRMFFVATAPLSADGHVNCSPKGGALAVLGPREVAYADLTGSGAETIAHLRENGRIVVMCCAFEGPPRIVRLHGRGGVVPVEAPEFAALAGHFAPHPGIRAIIRVRVERIADSCGYGVPLYDHVGPRETLEQWSVKKGAEGLSAYRAEKNAVSIDGLPALDERPGA
jgi:hypothetical protein